MEKRLKRMFNLSIIFSILLAILGVVMIIHPNVTLITMSKILAVYVIIRGIFKVILHFKEIDDYMPFDQLMPGIVCIVVGLILFTHLNYIETLVGILVGIWIVTESLNDINIGWKLRKTEAPWLITLILGIVSLIAGIILLVNPAESAEAVMVWSGIILLINSITSCIDKFIFKKYVKDIKKATKNFMKPFEEN